MRIGAAGIGGDSNAMGKAGQAGGAAVDPDSKDDPGAPNTAGSAAPAANGGRSAQPQGGAGGAAGADPSDPADGAAGSASQADAGSDAGGDEPEQGGTGGTGHSNGEAGSGGHAGAAGEDGLPPSSEPSAELTFLSETDRSHDVILSPDRLSAEWLGLANLGVRSTTSVGPHAGVFYFEAYADLDLFGIGVATASAPLDQGAGQTSNGYGIDTSGVIEEPHVEGQAFQRSAHGEYGFVVDYRGEHPTAHLITGSSESAKVAGSRTLSEVSEPLFIHLSGLRRSSGYQVTINPGNDTVNRPFVLDVRAALQASGHAELAQALVMGWGGTHAGAWNEPPELTVGSAPSQVDVGSAVSLTATASDAEGGVSDAQIVWDVLSLGIGPEHEHGTGGSFSFTPHAIGKHPVRVSVTDAGGKRSERVLTIEARGKLQQFSTVKLIKDEFTSSSIELSSDGLRAHWTEDKKNAVRANQGLYGDFWYVEGHRLVPEDNQAIGLVIGDVSLDPYEFNITPPSCSVNTTGPSVFHDLMYARSQQAPASSEYYGLAVDYRGDYPIVYVVIGGMLVTTLHLTDVTVPIYPMLYGNVNSHGANYDMEINFGAAPFHEDPVAVLKKADISTSELKLCWGAANSACP